MFFNSDKKLPDFMASHQLGKMNQPADYLDPYSDFEVEIPDHPDLADVVTSWEPTPYGFGGIPGSDSPQATHRPVLDIDFPAELIPSSTPGHFHLYLDKPMTWRKYEALLEALAKAGLIERGFANASIERGFSAARIPGIKKEQ